MSDYEEPPMPTDEDLRPAGGPDGISIPSIDVGKREADDDAIAIARLSAASATILNKRLAPHDIAAERNVIGSILLSEEVLFDALEIVNVQDFYIEKHREVMASIVRLSQQGKPIDVRTIGDDLLKAGKLALAGGVDYVNALDIEVPWSEHGPEYARIVRDKAILRRLAEGAHAIAKMAYDQRGEASDIQDAAEQKMLELSESARVGKKAGLREAEEIANKALKELQHRWKHGITVNGVSTGLRDLDALIGGLGRGDLIVIGGRPGMGKTAIGLQFALTATEKTNDHAIVFSYEMPAEMLMCRLASAKASVDLMQILRGRNLSEKMQEDVADAFGALMERKLLINDGRTAGIHEIRAETRRVKMKHGKVSAVMIDYAQLVPAPHGIDNREQQIAAISKGAKNLAGEMDCPVILLAQLNRDVEKRPDKRPGLADFRESGALEQDADVVIFPYRDEYYDKNSPDKGIAEIIIAKQRNGATGTVRTKFFDSFCRFNDVTYY